MPKSKEAKARAAKALKEKRHRLKAEQKVKAQVDAKGEVACEDCKKHIVAVISANLHIDRLKHVLEMQEDAQERTDAYVKASGERYEDMAQRATRMADIADNATTQLKQSRADWLVEKAEMEQRHALEVRQLLVEKGDLLARVKELEQAKEEASIFVDPKDSPSRSPLKKKGKWGGDRRSAKALKKQADKALALSSCSPSRKSS